MSLLDQTGGDSASLAPSSGAMSNNGSDRGRSPHSQSNLLLPEAGRDRNSSPSRQPTSAEIDAVIAAAMANAPPAPPEQHENMSRSVTPLMTNLLPAAVGADGRVNLFVGNLPYRVRWQDLKDLFRKAGTVLRADVSLGPDNRSRGYGTVLMGSREDAARAIDRFNGFTWQTRTLEVRPDRLPPEYEPQPHTLNHHVHPRPPLYTYHNMSGSSHQSFSHAAHMPPNQGPPWLPGQVPLQRPPSSHGMLGSGSMPGQGQLGMMGGPYPPHMGMPGRSPIPQSHSPHPMPGSLNMSHGSSEHVMQVPPPGASPLAGSLSYGPQGHADLVRRESVVSNGSGLTSETGNMGPLRNLSPALVPGTITRSRSDAGLNMGGASPLRLEQLPGQLGSHRGSVGHLPSGLFSKGLTPTTTGGQSSDAGASIPGPQINGSGIPTAAGVTIAMEGLSHQAQHMGPPNTLHDRVVFVSNLPLSMQWQELKDLLRPAGLIIRADVATRSDGRPRGFGTALFASETDAAKAVTMFNEREVAGNRIKVLLERDIVPESGRQSRANSATSLTPEGQSESAGSREGGSQGSSDAPRLPWALQTSLQSNTQATPRRGGPIGSEYTQQATPQQSHRPHHPGPISMPAFPGLDSPGFNNPLSPLQTRNLPPMTPSMPGFVFNAYPETPPLHPHFMSPGLGPFSPGIPVTSPGGFQYNPFLNPAPGGPVNRYPQAGSAALGTPTTTAFPSNPVHGYGAPGAIGGPGGDTSHQSLLQAVGDYFPPTSTGEPGSPTPRVPSRQNNSNQNPLNAKDRLASTTSVPASDSIDPLETSLADLSLEANAASSDGPATPMASKKTALPRTSQEGLSPTQTEVNGSNSRGSPFQPSSRASLDGLRPHLGHLGFGWDSNNGERRASFGDIASGKRASNE